MSTPARVGAAALASLALGLAPTCPPPRRRCTPRRPVGPPSSSPAPRASPGRSGWCPRQDGSTAWAEARFTNPTGRSLLLRERVGPGAGWLLRADLSGRTKVVMRGTEQGIGGKQNPAGTLVVGEGRGGMVVNGNATGVLVRRLPLPKGAGMCSVHHWSSETSFTAGCMVHVAGRLTTRTYRYATTGGAPVPVASGVTVTGLANPLVDDVWSTPSGTWARVSSPSCTALRLVKVFGRTGRLASGPAHGIAVLGSQAYLLDGGKGCDAAATRFVRRDLATGRTTVLAGGTRNPGFVVTSARLVSRQG